MTQYAMADAMISASYRESAPSKYWLRKNEKRRRRHVPRRAKLDGAFLDIGVAEVATRFG